MTRRRSGAQLPGRQPARAPYQYAGRDVHDAEFIQRVRRYTPSSLITIIAIAGSRWWNRETWFRTTAQRDRWIPPWALAEIARVSLIYGTEFNRAEATHDDLLACYAAYNGFIDPKLKDGTAEGLAGFLLRMSAEQLPMQQSGYGDYGRTPAMLLQTPWPDTYTPKVMSAGWDVELLGCTVVEYVAAASLLDTSASVPGNFGRFDLDWLTQPNFAPITDEVSSDVLGEVIGRQYVESRERLKLRQADVQARLAPVPAEHRRFGFNPLTARPVVAGLHDDLLIPVPALVTRKASPLGVYFEGLQKWGTAFTTDLGHLFEAYIGRQLRLLADATVHGEIRYGPRSSDLSVDWIAVFDSCLVLVEAKSCGPTEAIRVGADTASEHITGKLGRAVEQLNITARHIRDRTPGFESIPDDRPILGLVATLDPFHGVNSPLIGDVLPASGIPYMVCSASDVEQWVILDDESAGAVLLDHLSDPSRLGYSMSAALNGHIPHRNQVLDEGWTALPWRSDDEAE